MKPTIRLPLTLALLAAPLVMGGCDFGEERPFNYEKGTYLGKRDQPLDQATLDRLKARAAHQTGPGLSLAGGPSAPSYVRPPEPASAGPGVTFRTPAADADDDAAGDGDDRAERRQSPPSAETLRRRAEQQRSF